MTTAVRPDSHLADYTDVPHLVRSGVKLGVMQSVIVFLFALVSNRLSGPPELALDSLLLAVGVGATIVLPGAWTRARTIEGIAGGAGIGLIAAGVFLVIDVALFQPLGIYSNRWLEIGGGSNWWYHPVWWMVGTYLAWMGSWVQANQSAKSGAPAALQLVGGTYVLGAVCMVIAVLIHFPGASWGLGTFSLAILPAVAVMVAVSALGAGRG